MHTHHIVSVEWTLADEEATLTAGAQLAHRLKAGMVVYLQGDLGAGKTTLTRGILRALGVTGRIKSPTYALMEPYMVERMAVYHFDLYRFGDGREWFDAGFDECHTPNSLCLIEWPERARDYLPPPDLSVELAWAESGRLLTIRAFTPLGYACLIPLSTRNADD